MSILKKYILVEHIRPFLFGLFIFVFILFMGNMGQLIRMLTGPSGELLSVLAVIRNIIIYAGSFSIPMACLLAVLLAVGRLNSDSEITAVKACGLNPAVLMLPVLLITLLISLFSVRLNAEIVPRATTQTERLLSELARREPAMFIQERMLIEDFSGHILYVQRERGDRLYGVQITKLREGGFPVNITAKEGEILESADDGILRIRLLNGTVDEADRDEPFTYSRTSFNEYFINLELPGREEAGLRRRPKDMTVAELHEKAGEMAELNMDPVPLVTEIHRKHAQSFAPVALVLMALPLSLKVKKGGKSVGFGMCLLVVILYYSLFTAAQTLAERQITGAVFVWAPNMLFSAAGILLLIRQR